VSDEFPALLAQSWGLRDIGFSPADVAAAGSVAARLREGRPEPEAILVGGDRALGLGQVSSAIDLCVIGALPPDAARVYDVDGSRVEVSVIPSAEAEELLTLATAYRATSRWSPQLAVGPDRVRDLIRLVMGRRLVTGPRWVAPFSVVDRDAVRQLLIGRAALDFAGSAADAFAALRSGDLFTSISASGHALLAGCEAVLASAGDLDADLRFVFRRLARTPATAPWCGRLWQLSNTLPADVVPDPAAVRAVVEERLLAGNLLLTWCAIEGWDKQLTNFADAATLLEPMDTMGPRRSAYFVPMRFADGWALLGPARTYQTTEGMIRLWRRLVGRSPDAAVHDLAGAEPGIAGMSIEDIETAVTVLKGIGALEAPTSWSDSAWSEAAESRPAPRPELSIIPTTRFG